MIAFSVSSFFFSSRRRHTRLVSDWSSDVCSSDLEYHSLQGAFGRRATIEQAKGILMARHAIDADRAFEMLRDHSQHNGHKLVDIAQAIVDSHLLLLPPLPQPATPSEQPA